MFVSHAKLIPGDEVGESLPSGGEEDRSESERGGFLMLNSFYKYLVLCQLSAAIKRYDVR